jgi:hypothetical protein
MPPDHVNQKQVSIAQVHVKLAEQGREVALNKARLAAEEVKLSDMQLELAKAIVQAEEHAEKVKDIEKPQSTTLP